MKGTNRPRTMRSDPKVVTKRAPAHYRLEPRIPHKEWGRIGKFEPVAYKGLRRT